MREINIIGLGYIGLPTALMFAKSGISVIGTDIDLALINSLNQGNLLFDEVGLEETFQVARTNGVKFTTKLEKTDTYIIAVPTPYIKDSKKLDPSYIISALHSVLEICNEGAVLIIESTVSPGTI